MLQPNKQLSLSLAIFLAISLGYASSEPSLGKPVFQSPLVAAKLINSYRQSETPYSSGHRGVDYQVKLGQGIFAPADGSVFFSGLVVDRPVVSLSHGDYLISFEPACSTYKKAEAVSRGELLAEVCEADSDYHQHCEAVRCLHFSVRKNGEYLSPLWLTGELNKSRLLPWFDPD